MGAVGVMHRWCCGTQEWLWCHAVMTTFHGRRPLGADAGRAYRPGRDGWIWLAGAWRYVTHEGSERDA